MLVGCQRHGNALGERWIDVDHRHAGAGLSEGRGGGPTDAPAGTGHHGHLIFEEHRHLPRGILGAAELVGPAQDWAASAARRALERKVLQR